MKSKRPWVFSIDMLSQYERYCKVTTKGIENIYSKCRNLFYLTCLSLDIQQRSTLLPKKKHTYCFHQKCRVKVSNIPSSKSHHFKTQCPLKKKKRGGGGERERGNDVQLSPLSWSHSAFFCYSFVKVIRYRKTFPGFAVFECALFYAGADEVHVPRLLLT